MTNLPVNELVWRYRFTQGLVLATLILIFAGGLVTSTDSGLAVPDWPLSYGSFFPPMIGGIRFEHTHRVIAATVGFLTLVVAIWTAKSEKRPWVRRIALASFGAVLLQGILGGLTVLFFLPAPISVAHACLGPIFFCLVVSLAVLTSPQKEESSLGTLQSKEIQTFNRLSGFTALFVFIQLLLGSVVRHAGQRIATGLHVSLAFAILFLIGRVVSRAVRDFSGVKEILRPAAFLGVAVILEFFLGVSAFVFTQVKGIPPGIPTVLFPTLHQTLGVLILAASVVLTLRSRGGITHSTSEKVEWLALLEVTKPRLVLLVLWSVGVGFYLAPAPAFHFSRLAETLLGVLLVAGGAMALNQFLERECDAKMKRTENRPLASQRIRPEPVLLFGVLASLLGILELSLRVNLLTGLLAALTLLTYLFVYTPLKVRTPFCTVVGAIPGAMPPLLGWSAAGGALTIEAAILFLILFLWQLPHFLAISWAYREDYAQAGFQMLAVVNPTGEKVKRRAVIYTALLLPVTLLPTVVGMAGSIYLWGSLFLGIGFLAFSLWAAQDFNQRALWLFRYSILYLTFLLLLLVLNHRSV